MPQPADSHGGSHGGTTAPGWPDECTPEVEFTLDAAGDATLGAARPLPPCIGRYWLLERIGAGGMGVVLGAYDTKLDRRVAIKLLHARGHGLNAAARLQREAQALARLSHPNVVAVFDTGTLDGRSFIAMEWIHGRTLAAWLRERPRPWTEVLAMFLGAAAGLAAAHAAGVIHRDFKPENVLVGDDGRPRVLDFGLALGRGDDSGDTPAVVLATPSPLAMRLTADDVVVGTPAYMAPEQRRGEPADARADQYSFCVALHEALFGERPHPDGGGALAGSRSVPAWLRRALARGLAPRPGDRWPSMAALVAALSPRRRRAHAVAAGAALLLGVLGWQTVHGGERGPCASAGMVAHTSWNDHAQARVHAAITATGRGYADDTWQRVHDELDAYAAQAAALREAVCGGPLPPAERQRQTACLDLRDAAFDAVIDVLAQTDADSLARATAVAAGLPALDACLDPAAAAIELSLPSAPDIRDEVADIREGLLTVHALRDAKRFTDGIARARELEARADATGFAPIAAQARLELGGLLELVGDHRGAQAELTAAALGALAAGDDATAARAMTRLVGVVGYHLAQLDEGLRWSRHAEAMAARATDDPRNDALLRNSIAALHFRAGDYARAERGYREAIARLGDTEDVGQRQELATAHNNLGNVLARQGRLADASVEIERGLAVLVELLGPGHPTVATGLVNLGNIAYDLGDFATAHDHHGRARAILDDSVGPRHPLVAAALGNHALVLHRLGHHEQAVEVFVQSIALKRELLGAQHPDVAFSLSNLGEVYRELGRAELALQQHRAALEIWQSNAADHPYAIFPMTNIGLDLLALGRIDEAKLALQQAVTAGLARQTDPTIVAAARFGLAQAMVAAGEPRVDAEAVAREALASYAEIGGRYVLERDRIASWLAAG